MAKRKLSKEHISKMQEARKKKKNYVVFVLDKKTRIAANKHCFTIDTKAKEDEWRNKYYYSTLYDAILGYVKYVSKEAKRKLPDGIEGVLGHLDDLEKLVHETAKSMQDQIGSRFKMGLAANGEDSE